MAGDDSICGWSKERIKKELKQLKKMVKEPSFLCKNCGRAAEKKKWLCKPTKI